LVVDASRLAFIDSSGLAVLVSIQNRLHEQGRRLVLRSVKPGVRRVLEMTNLSDFLNVEPTIAGEET
jgi:anti-sigma B factor antagonist